MLASGGGACALGRRWTRAACGDTVVLVSAAWYTTKQSLWEAAIRYTFKVYAIREPKFTLIAAVRALKSSLRDKAGGSEARSRRIGSAGGISMTDLFG